MNQRNYFSAGQKVLYFIALTCIIGYIIYIISGVREKDIPDSLLTIYSLVISSVLILVGKLLDKDNDKDDDDDEPMAKTMIKTQPRKKRRTYGKKTTVRERSPTI